MAVIQTMGLSKRYKDSWAVDHLDLRVEQGDIYGFIGRNGAGKSTTLKLLCGLAQPTQGEALIFGKPIRDSVARRRVGSLIEQPGLYPDLSGRENLRLYATLLGLDSPARQVDEILETVCLSPKEKKPVKHYSMGMKQRLGVGLALLGGPDLLLLDEPINGLDPEGVAEFRQILRTLNRERQTTILISSHILSELANVATRYGFMEQGKILEEISAEALHDKCRICLRLEVDDAARAAAILQTQLGTDKFEVLPGNAIQLYDCLDDPKRASYALAQNGVALLAMEQKGADLEAYFLNLIGGGRHA